MASKARFLPTRTRRLGTRVAVSTAIALGAAYAVPARAVTIGVGQTVDLVANTIYPPAPPLVLDGGRLRVGNPSTGQALTIAATDAVLGRGIIDHWYSQIGTTSIE